MLWLNCNKCYLIMGQYSHLCISRNHDRKTGLTHLVDLARMLSKGGCVKIKTREEGVRPILADVINGSPLAKDAG